MRCLPRVVCFQQRLTHYRETFFQRCRDLLFAQDILFDLVHGKPDSSAQKKNDAGYLPWAYQVDQIAFSVGLTSAIWLPMPRALKRRDLIIIPQENKLLANYSWLIKRQLGGPKLAFWGHGRNFQTDAPRGVRERFKQALVGQVDWWFAYTSLTREILLSDGYPDDRITVLNNAIDTEAFQADLAAVTEEDLSILQQVVGRGPVGLFCGSLYPDKRIDYMIAAADRIKDSIPGFSLVVIGDGPSGEEVRIAAKSRPWLHPIGVKKGREKAAWFKMASVVLNPGLVGLHIVDSFCAGVPMVTTADAKHSPEIAYLKSGCNGLIVPGGIEEYSNSVINLLNDQPSLNAMRQMAIDSASRYSLNSMVENYCDGIVRCLALPKK